MNVLEKITEANGWEMSVAGILTVFVALVCIWFFVAVYSRIMDKFASKEKTGEAPDTLHKKSDPVTAAVTVNNEIEPAPEMSEPADDFLPKMAAAAAVSVFIKRRKERFMALLPKPAQAVNLWKATARVQGLSNLPTRNTWKGR